MRITISSLFLLPLVRPFSPNQTVRDAQQSSLSSAADCQPHQLAECFFSAIAEIGILQRGKEMQCHKYATFMFCFENTRCDKGVIAKVASDTYKMSTGKSAPKESFIALHGAVKEYCERPCDTGGNNWSCRALMNTHVQDNDQALYMEMSGQARQLELRLYSIRDGCRRFVRSLRRWLEFRSHICPDMIACACHNERLASSIYTCDVDCATLTNDIRYIRSHLTRRSAARRTNRGRLYFVSVIFIVLFSVIRFNY